MKRALRVTLLSTWVVPFLWLSALPAEADADPADTATPFCDDLDSLSQDCVDQLGADHALCQDLDELAASCDVPGDDDDDDDDDCDNVTDNGHGHRNGGMMDNGKNRKNQDGHMTCATGGSGTTSASLLCGLTLLGLWRRSSRRGQSHLR